MIAELNGQKVAAVKWSFNQEAGDEVKIKRIFEKIVMKGVGG